ncbi:MAG: hypothetical protein ACP5FK_11285 [bacterium]
MKIILVIGLLFCFNSFLSADYQDIVNDFSSLLDNVRGSPYDESRFDVNLYFSVLTHISMESGYVLDFIYLSSGGDGSPILISREELVDRKIIEQEIVNNYEMDFEKFLEFCSAYTDHVVMEDTVQGYFELVLLIVMGEQFYLSWHGNYNDRRIIAGDQGIDDVLNQEIEFGQEFSDEFIQQAENLDPSPVIQDLGDQVMVKVLTFTKWGGFQTATFLISKNFPHEIQLDGYETVVAYNCGVRF